MSFSTWPGYLAGHRWSSEPFSPATAADRRPPPPPLATGDDDDDLPQPRRQQWTRALGILEAKFDKATQRDGQSDTFVRLALTLDLNLDPPHAATTAFLSRLLLAWASLRAKHPLLACTVRDAPQGKHAPIPLVDSREFVLVPPLDAAEALSQAAQTLLVHSVEDGESVQAAADEVQDRYVLNGPRALLAQDECLARLVVVRSEREPLELGFVLVISHVISDGLSVFKLVNELFSLASSPELPEAPSSAPCLSLSSFLDGTREVEAWDVPADVATAWRVVLPENELASHLPLANEELYPSIPLSSPTPTVPVQPTENPSSTTSLPPAPPVPASTARRRWLWAITRTLIMARQRRFPRTLYFPRLEAPTPPPQARNRWPQLRFERETSQRLIRLCKTEGISPSMLLYSLISLSVARIFRRVHADKPYHPVVLGFPFSARPFLQRTPPPGAAADDPAHAPRGSSDPATDCAIRITFGCIAMPALALDAPTDPAQRALVGATVLRGARLAKAQFARLLSQEHTRRTVFVAGMYTMILDRLLNGTGRNPIPYNEPRTALNASMIGDVDRLLPTSFALPSPSSSSSSSSTSSSSGPTLRLHDVAIGTRLHRGEGMLLEAFTWDGQVTLCLGVDDGLMDPRLVDELLEGVRELGEAVAHEGGV
ncbi:hypothetical protein JCM3775_001076 [Rhodotorula graminis]